MNTPKIPTPQTPSPAELTRRTPPPTQHDQLVHHTQRLVAQTFFGTLLKQMRQGPFKSETFSGGRGGQMFSELLDQHLADRMASGSGRKLVNSIVHHIERGRHIDSKPAPGGINPTVKSAYAPAQKASSNVPAGLRA